MWQPAEGGEAISAAEAGYGTIAGNEGVVSEAALAEGAVAAAPTETAPETEDVDDEESQPRAPEEAALHVDTEVADEAADELASDSDLDEEPAVVRTEEEAEIEETAGDQS